MAIIHRRFLSSLSHILRRSMNTKTPAFYFDVVMHLLEYCVAEEADRIEFPSHHAFSEGEIQKAKAGYADRGVVGVYASLFGGNILDPIVDTETERKVIALKTGFRGLPATTTSTILRGFGHTLSTDDVRAIYASYGLSPSMKGLRQTYDFVDLNRRIDRLDRLTKEGDISEEMGKIRKRFLAVRAYVVAPRGKKKEAVEAGDLNRGLFSYYWKSFRKYGVLGLVDKGKEVFRESKIGLSNEAHIIIDKVQNLDRKESFYVKRMKSKGVRIDRSSVSRLLSRWDVSGYRSEFVTNLKRLEKMPEQEEEQKAEIAVATVKPVRMVELHFINLLKGMRRNGIYVDAPGLPVLWAYLEELGIFPILESMGLTRSETKKGYSWFDLFLLDVARRFYGIRSHSLTCLHEEPSLALFSHLLALPCNDSFLNGLGKITEEQTYQLRSWLVRRAKELVLLRGARLAGDFHHIDLDVQLGKLRDFGKGPSPKKKVCCNGFRPHIAWDLDTGNMMVGEFRKASARGTTTVKRFVRDYLLPSFRDLFESVYVDSEYTGRDVWNFILDHERGMGAHLTACLKQNAFVKRRRDEFLQENQGDEDFWVFYDNDHVLSSKTFPLTWSCPSGNGDKEKRFTLSCVVKKKTKDGRLRCFGTSKTGRDPFEILEDYSHRWIVENGIKDLIHSYYLDNTQ